MSTSSTDPGWFRQVLGQYPTGVCVVTGLGDDDTPLGMAVGSFTSVSLDPPLVAFMPDKGSSTWPKIGRSGRFCVSILSADQEDVCRRFATKLPNKFENMTWRPSPNDCPIIVGCVAWIACDIHSISEAGDHFIVIGRVTDLHVEMAGLPLLFFQGGYGRFMPQSMAAADPLGNVSEQLRHVDLARPQMEAVTSELQARCLATARLGEEIAVLASAGSAGPGSVATVVGQRFPFVPATCAIFVAWSSQAAIDLVRRRVRPEARAALDLVIHVVRERGYSLALVNEAQRAFARIIRELGEPGAQDRKVDLRGLIEQLSYDPIELSAEVARRTRHISAPVFGESGDVVLVLTLHEFPNPAPEGIARYVRRLLDATDEITLRVGGTVPPRADIDASLF